MLKLMTTKGKHGPVLVCDVCGELCKVGSSMAVWNDDPAEGETAELFHVHKGRCDDQFRQRSSKSTAWHELTTHIVWLEHNVGGISDDDRESAAIMETI